MKKNNNLNLFNKRIFKYGLTITIIASMNIVPVLANPSPTESESDSIGFANTVLPEYEPSKTQFTYQPLVKNKDLIQCLNSTTVHDLEKAHEADSDEFIFVDDLTQEELKEIEEKPAVNDPEKINNEVSSAGFTHYAINDNGEEIYLSEDLQNWVYQMCAEYGISGYEKLIISKLYCESGFNANTKHLNKNGTVDYGIAQINSSNHSWLRNILGITDFMDPYQSIRCGVYMMSENLKRNGYNESMALVAYNTGKNGIQSTTYSKKVLKIKEAATEY